MNRPLNEYLVTELVEGLEEGAFSAMDVVEACLERIAARDEIVQAWVALDPERARASARHPSGGPLRGIPFGVKDVFRTAELPTGMGAAAHAGSTDRFDAAAVAVLRGSGGLVLGKTATAEYAGTAPAETRHPAAPAHTPGGSSSGSAAAVADRMVPFALGTQTGGSVIRPAAFCGVVGFKPSFGLYPVDGLKMAAQSFDTVGLIARGAEDIALLHSIFMRCGRPERGAPLRIGLLGSHLEASLQPGMAAAIDETAACLAGAGCTVTRLATPDWLASLTEHRAIVNAFERFAALAPEALACHDSFRAETAATWDRGREVTGETYLTARRTIDECRQRTASLFDGVDILLSPAVPGEAPKGLRSTGDPRLQELWTTLHLPTVCLPIGHGPRGLPLSAQFVAPLYDDARLLSAAMWVERTLAATA